MSGARLAEPGERFVILGSVNPNADGVTGVVVGPITEGHRLYNNYTKMVIMRYGPVMEIRTKHRIMGGTLAGCPHKWLIAIDGDPDAQTRDADEPITDEVAA